MSGHIFSPRSLKLKTLTVLAGASLLLSACSMFESSDPEVIIEGDRISILQLEKQLVPEDIANKENMYLPPAWQNEYWPQNGGYPNHAMHNLSLGTKDKAVSRIWSANIGQGTTKKLPLSASPVVFEKQIFAMDTTQHVTALSTENGKEQWRIDLKPEDEDENVTGGGISVANGVVYVTSGFNEAYALSAADGEQIWESKLPAPARSAPTVISGRAFIVTADSRLVCLSADTGEILWEYQGISEMTGLTGTASPAADSDIVVPAFSSGEIYALRIENGSVAWSDNLSPIRRYSGMDDLVEIRGLPVIAREVVIAISFGGRMVAIDTRSGQRIWARSIGGSQTPWVAGDYIYVLTSDSELVALSRMSGQVVWVDALPAYEDVKDREDPIIWRGPVMANDRVFIVGSNGEMREYDPRSGEQITSWDTKESIALPPIIAGGTLYLTAESGKILAYR
ncbi:MAG: PQQ-binding-like beta-propeller repeat protein [Pseudomonadota bacterium]|jgi:outer membrane protein assembly factor BamB|nr:PQQ-binding-like beta-propeller repeat protein [Pseudomonadota bacterium]MEC7701910.1 PQQ-binding-like beta-propeller repeat protein [Pseudomonadota bacterium]MEC9236289.1 PQQ-binding-like beta-propeller repeat protein [Pseudomonadota bacterium]MEE3323267.1 PQQ-binding-like beta-propeller repeat protein [Pseudomonadota bacterium]